MSAIGRAARDAALRELPNLVFMEEVWLGFRTNVPGVQIPAAALAKYPAAMKLCLTSATLGSPIEIEGDVLLLDVFLPGAGAGFIRVPFSAVIEVVSPPGLMLLVEADEAGQAAPAKAPAMRIVK